MTDLAQRYGIGRRRRTGPALVFAAVAGLALVVVSVWAFLDQADPEVRSSITRYDVVDEGLVTADLVVVRKTSETVATCLLHAVAEDHSTVGRLEVTVDSGPARQTVPIEVRTERRAVGVVRDGCTAPGQERAR